MSCVLPTLALLTRPPPPHTLATPTQDSDGPPRPECVLPPAFPPLRQSRVVSSTSEEEEALTEKFLKINCKYITDGKVRWGSRLLHILHTVLEKSLRS